MGRSEHPQGRVCRPNGLLRQVNQHPSLPARLLHTDVRSARTTAHRSGRHASEWMDGMNRNQWTACAGMSGRHASESAWPGAHGRPPAASNSAAVAAVALSSPTWQGAVTNYPPTPGDRHAPESVIGLLELVNSIVGIRSESRDREASADSEAPEPEVPAEGYGVGVTTVIMWPRSVSCTGGTGPRQTSGGTSGRKRRSGVSS